MPAALNYMSEFESNNTRYTAAEIQRQIQSLKAQIDALTEERRNIDTLISGLKANLAAIESPVPSEEQTDEYEGLSVTDAAIIFIRRTGRPQTEDALVRELQRGGWKAKSPGTEEGNIRRGLGAGNAKGLIKISDNPPTYDVKKQ